MILPKKVKIFLAATTLILVGISVWFASSQIPGNNSNFPTPTDFPTPTLTRTANPTAIPTNTQKPTSTATSPPITNQTPTSIPTPIPTPVPTPPLTSISISFDFDKGTPTPIAFMSSPFNQTKSGLTAQFSSSSDPAGFSIQNSATTNFKLSQFQGNYLYDNKPSRDILEIRFSQSINNCTFSFATFESHGGPTSLPAFMRLTAYMNSTANVIGSTTAQGAWPIVGDNYPQGTLIFSSGNQAFNMVRIELPIQIGSTAIDYLIDTIIITTV